MKYTVSTYLSIAINNGMRLFEIYKEEPGSSFIHDGKSYDLNKLFKLSQHLDSEQYRVSDMTWILNFDTPEPSLYDHINLSAPLLITKWYDSSVKAWRHVVVDGLHRLYVAKINRVSHLPGKMIPEDMLNKCLIG